VVSKGVYGKYVYTLRTLSVSSCFPQYEHETLLPLHVFVRPPHAVTLVLPFRRLPFDFVVHRLHVFAPVLPAHLLLDAAALGARNSIPALTTLCRYGSVVRTDNGKKRLFWAIAINLRNHLVLLRQRAHAKDTIHTMVDRSQAPSLRPSQLARKGSKAC
jgi:hypothetical protein